MACCSNQSPFLRARAWSFLPATRACDHARKHLVRWKWRLLSNSKTKRKAFLKSLTSELVRAGRAHLIVLGYPFGIKRTLVRQAWHFIFQKIKKSEFLGTFLHFRGTRFFILNIQKWASKHILVLYFKRTEFMISTLVLINFTMIIWDIDYNCNSIVTFMDHVAGCRATRVNLPRAC